MATSISILGNTGRDVELRYSPEGLALAGFTIASNTVRKTAQGTVKKTDWYNVTAFGKQAETLSKHLKKGDQILVRGKLTFNPWLGRDGEARVNADVALQDFEFVGGSASSETAASERQPQTARNHQPRVRENAEHTLTTAEMIDALSEVDSGDEPFANQF